MAVFVINTLGEGLRHYIPSQLGLDTKQIAQKGVDKNIDLKAIDRIFDELLRILEHGLDDRPIKANFEINNINTAKNYL